MISTRAATSSLVAFILSSLIFLASSTSVVRAEENQGLEDLDKATDLQLRVQNLQDLDQVVTLCESALEKGLDKDNMQFAKQLLVSSLWQHASQLATAIFDQPRPDPRWATIRELVTKNLDKLLKHDETFAEAHVLNAKLQALPGGNRENSLKSASTAIELYEKKKDAQELAKTYILRAQLREDKDERMADVEAAIKADPASVEALQLRAAVHIEQGEVDKAIADFEELLKQNPENLAVLQALATTYASTKNYDKALEHLSKAIELAPENALNFAMRAEVYELKRSTTTLADLTQSLKVQPNTRQHCWRGLGCTTFGRTSTRRVPTSIGCCKSGPA